MKEILEKKKSKTIKIDLTDTEYAYILEQASLIKCSLRQFVKMKALDDEAKSGMRCRQVAQLMPEFYNCVNQVGDSRTRHELTEIGGAICRCLQ